MADKNAKHKGNAPGKYYVDDSCIDCDACRSTAPNNFQRDDDTGVAYVSRQPENEEERQACQDAKDGCPVEAIGDDGE
jgi:ferredoxin